MQRSRLQGEPTEQPELQTEEKWKYSTTGDSPVVV